MSWQPNMHSSLFINIYYYVTKNTGIDGIDALIGSSLLLRIPGPSHESRYVMLEVVREYGLEVLEAQDELGAAQSAHAGHYASNREWLDPNRFGRDERLIDHFWDIDAEYPNIRVALSTCDATGDYARMLDIAAAVAVFCHHRGLLGESRFWLERALAGAPDASPESRCWGLAGLGLTRWTQCDYVAAEPVLLEALQRAGELGHMELRALSLHLLALVDMERMRPMQARDRIEEALELWRVLDLPSNEAMALNILSWIPTRPGEADNRLHDAFSSLTLFESIGHISGVGLARQRFGRLTHEAGDERGAFEYYAQAISAWLSIDERWAINRALVMVARLANAHHHFDTAAMLIGVIDSRRALSDSGLSRDNQTMFDDICQTAEAKLGQQAFQRKRLLGSKLELHEIDALVRDLGTRLFTRSLLSPREREVLQRVAVGETDREIAGALFVSPRTVHSHISHILAKLDATSRREAVRRARELGLLEESLSTSS